MSQFYVNASQSTAVITPADGGTGVSNPTAHTLPVAEGAAPFNFLGPLTNGQLLIGSTGADPVPNTITAGAGMVVTNGAGTISLSTTGGGIKWNVVSTNQAMLVDNGYDAISPGGALTFSLPATSAVGDEVVLTLDGATSWQITQGAAQQIRMGTSQTTSGAGGSLTSNQQGDTVTLVCTVANTRWNVLSSMGNITVV